jgi:ABC-type uncharacterized transport system auxiliary subunit
MKARLPAILVGALGLAGCFSLGGSPEEKHEYDLRPVAEDPLAVAPLGTTATIEVEPFGIDEAIDRDAIVWRRGAEVGSYATHRWARPPQRAVREGVAAALQAALGATSAATEPPLADSELVLRAHLARCEEVDDDGAWSGAIELRVTLARRDGVELLRRTYAETERASARNPLAVVLALDRALARIGRDIASDVARVGRGVAAVRPGAGAEELR